MNLTMSARTKRSYMNLTSAFRHHETYAEDVARAAAAARAARSPHSLHAEHAARTVLNPRFARAVRAARRMTFLSNTGRIPRLKLSPGGKLEVKKVKVKVKFKLN